MDRVDKLNTILQEVSNKFNDLKNCGIDEEILIIYLKDKTKLSKKAINSVIYHTTEFFNKLIKVEAVNKLK